MKPFFVLFCYRLSVVKARKKPGLYREVASVLPARATLREGSIFPWDFNPLNPLFCEGKFARCRKNIVNGAGIICAFFVTRVESSIHDVDIVVEVVIYHIHWTSF